MDTTYAQLIILSVNFLTLVVAGILARKLLRPSGTLRDVQRELETIKLDLSDLIDRFTTWQKRDGMRQARAGKETDTNLKEELEKLALAKSLAPAAGTNAAFRAKFRGKTTNG